MSIKEQLQGLKENDLRKKIVIPYLKVCFPYVKDWHGSEEKGKDIIYITKDEEWKHDIIGAVVIKNSGDIKMSGNINSNIRILHSQIMETIKRPIPFPLDPGQTRYIDTIIVLTSYDINIRAMEFINTNIYPQIHIVKFIPGHKFEEIIQGFIKDKNYKFDKKYNFECNTFENFCSNFPCSSSIKEEMKIINIEGEGRNIDEDAQSETKFL